MLQDKHLKIIERYGENTIRTQWYRLGYRRAAERLGITVGVLRTIVRNKEWKKPAKYLPSVEKAVSNGSASKDDFPYVCFDKTDESEAGNSQESFIYNDEIEIILIPVESENSTFSDKSFLLQININKSSSKID